MHTDGHKHRSPMTPFHSPRNARHLNRPIGLQSKVMRYMRSRASFGMQPIQTPVSIIGEGFYYTSQSLSTVWSSVSECQQQHVFSLRPYPPSFRQSLQISIFQVPILKGEPLLLPLAPFLIVKVNVSALFKLICDGLRFFMSLKPHHILGVKPPGLLFQSLCRQILSLGTL